MVNVNTYKPGVTSSSQRVSFANKSVIRAIIEYFFLEIIKGTRKPLEVGHTVTMPSFAALLSVLNVNNLFLGRELSEKIEGRGGGAKPHMNNETCFLQGLISPKSQWGARTRPI